MRQSLLNAPAAAALVAVLASCAQEPDVQGNRSTITGATAGAVIGGVIGNVVAAPGLRGQGTAIGAAVGATLGGAVGRGLDLERRRLESQLAEERRRNDVQIRQLREDVLLLTLGNGLNFPTGSAIVDSYMRQSLSKIADVIRGAPGTQVGVIGHTDNVGGAELNQALSERRAIAVRNELVAFGVPAGSLFPLGRGMSEPRADNATEAGRAMNRRVDLVLTRPQGA